MKRLAAIILHDGRDLIAADDRNIPRPVKHQDAFFVECDEDTHPTDAIAGFLAGAYDLHPAYEDLVFLLKANHDTEVGTRIAYFAWNVPFFQKLGIVCGPAGFATLTRMTHVTTCPFGDVYHDSFKLAVKKLLTMLPNR